MKGLSEQECRDLLPEGLILAGYRGSIAHGTWRPRNDPTSIDDKDLMGVFIPPIDAYFGLRRVKKGPRPFERTLREWDVVAYELRHYISLLLKSNPNVMGLLWLADNHYVCVTEMGQRLIDNRDLFVTKSAYKSFAGYAHGQLHKMTHFKFEGYMGEKRKRLVERFGFDCKNAAHLVRLLRMCIEFLTEGKLYVQRNDATQLLEIKRGEWTLGQVKAESDRLFALAHEAYVHSALPAHSDFEGAERLCVEMLKDHLGFSGGENVND